MDENIYIIKKRKERGSEAMDELVVSFIGSDVVIRLIGVSGYEIGKIIDVKEGWIKLQREEDGQFDLVNIDCILMIREHPLNKEGKKRRVSPCY